MSPRWAGGLELGTDDHSENTAEEECEDWSSDELGRVGRAARDYISEVRESSLWAPLCDCLTPADVPVLRTVGSKCFYAKFYGEFAELWFFLIKKERYGCVPTCSPAGMD